MHAQNEIKTMPIKKKFIPLRMKPVFETQPTYANISPTSHHNNNSNINNNNHLPQRPTLANLPELNTPNSSSSNRRSLSGNHGTEKISANYFTGVATIPPIDQKFQNK